MCACWTECIDNNECIMASQVNVIADVSWMHGRCTESDSPLRLTLMFIYHADVGRHAIGDKLIRKRQLT